MSDIYKMMDFEEGWESRPYLCSEDYPTVGFGFKLGPKGAPIEQYDFELPRNVGESWLSSILRKNFKTMQDHNQIGPAMYGCGTVRAAVLQSMAYQMGVDGLGKFINTLSAIKAGHWELAKAGMLDSKWARQTPERAQRHAEQMLTGKWCPDY